MNNLGGYDSIILDPSPTCIRKDDFVNGNSTNLNYYLERTSRKNELRHIHYRNMGLSRIFEFQLVVDKGNHAIHELIYIELV